MEGAEVREKWLRELGKGNVWRKDENTIQILASADTGLYLSQVLPLNPYFSFRNGGMGCGLNSPPKLLNSV